MATRILPVRPLSFTVLFVLSVSLIIDVIKFVRSMRRHG